MQYGVFSIVDRRKLTKQYCYLVPPYWKEGSICLLPFGRNIVRGILLYKRNRLECSYQIKNGIKRVGQVSRKYYFFLLVNLIKSNIKPGYCLNSFGKLLSERKIPVKKAAWSVENNFDELQYLGEEQLGVFNFITLHSKPKPLLIVAPTGWGKTRLIFAMALRNLKLGISTLIMNPEIFLTNQSYQEFKDLYPINQNRTFLWHSKTTPREKRTVWENLANPSVIFGTRSSLFLPFQNRTCVLVDEANDSNYLQREWPYYDTLSLIINNPYRFTGTVLFTATVNQQLVFLTRTKRIRTKVIGHDYTLGIKERLVDENIVTPEIVVEIWRHFLRGNTTIIYVNHRGYSNRILNLKTCDYVRCYCGRYVYFHDTQKVWKCHNCKTNHSPASYRLRYNEYLYPGVGVEKVYWHLSNYFRKRDLIWFSSDLPKSRMQRLWNELRNRPLVIVVTQGFIKGYHLQSVQNLYYVDTHYSRNWTQQDKLIKLIQFAGRGENRKVQVLTYDRTQDYLVRMNRSRSWHSTLVNLCRGLTEEKISVEFRLDKANVVPLTEKLRSRIGSLSIHGRRVSCKISLGNLWILNGLNLKVTID